MRPVAVRCVHDICKAIDAPVLATGGVATGRDVVEMTLVGADAVGIGTAAYHRGVDVFGQVVEELRQYMQRRGFKRLRDFRGKAMPASD